MAAFYVTEVSTDLSQTDHAFFYVGFVFRISYFVFESFKEGSPSAEAVFQGALR